MHRACYDLLGRSELDYTAIDVSAEELPEFWAQIDASWLGLSLTMPLKIAVLPYLAGTDAYAARTGAVNTVLFTEEGPMGFNTDVIGFLEVLHAFGMNPSTLKDHPGHVLVLGAGATAASALCAVQELGLNHAAVAARNTEAVAELASRFPAIQVNAVSLDSRTSFVAEVVTAVGNQAQAPTILINTLPIDAMTPQLLGAVSALASTSNCLLVDSLYDPCPPPLLNAWQAAGGTGVDGRALLREQGLAQVLLFTGAVVDADTLAHMRAAATAAIA